MVKPIENLNIVPHPLGSELDLNWTLPSKLPENFHVILFKSKTEINSEKVNEYFQLTRELEQAINNEQDGAPIVKKISEYYKETGYFISRLTKFNTSFTDMLCSNGKKQYYAIYIRDLKTTEISQGVLVDGTPNITAKTEILDGKRLITKATIRLLRSLEEANPPEKLVVHVQPAFGIIETVDQWVTVTRAAADVEQRFMGNMLYNYSGYAATGIIEKEVIQISWFSRNNPEYLDALTRLFRANQESFVRFAYHYGAIECLITMMPDGVDDRDNDGKTLFSGMLVALISETKTFQPVDGAPVEFELISQSECENG